MLQLYTCYEFKDILTLFYEREVYSELKWNLFKKEKNALSISSFQLEYTINEGERFT